MGTCRRLSRWLRSVITASFNHCYQSSEARFDARAWTIPDPTEVANYFIWRQQDASRNSISMLAHHYFSHKELQGKSGPEMQDMLHDSQGINWNDMPTAFKRGRSIVYKEGIGLPRLDAGWRVDNEIPVFTSDEGRLWLKGRIPRYA